MFRRRRPLMRAAVVGGGAYVAGKCAGGGQRNGDQQENGQDERLYNLEQQSAGHSGPSGPAAARRGTALAPAFPMRFAISAPRK